jgi:hypothetical protein
MPTLDDIDITTRQTGDQSRGVHILGTNTGNGRRSVDATSGSDKGKEKIVPSESATRARS